MTETGEKTKKPLKRKKLRHNEYYNTQEMFDNLYKASKEERTFNNLYEMIISPNNVKLAYRNIKKNKGSNTPGINGNKIIEMGKYGSEELVDYVKNRLADFKPHKVKRKEVEKPNGGIRPLGIPTIEDRLIQQCFLQVLEPICEAKFHNHSYGFRPNRGTIHAYSRAVTLANKNKLHYVVDVDIKGFFDNVNHGKLLKQMWSLGIRDKKVLSIIGKFLKAEIKGVGKPDKGTPQGGILSPLLSNIVLNEFDWWVSDQWETFETRHDYTLIRKISGKIRTDRSGKYRTLKRASKLKEMFIVRYADDFKIFCRNHKTAFKVFESVKKWLNKRLGLEISKEKSKVINLRKNFSEFLGFKFKVVQKSNKLVVKSHVSDKAIKRIKEKLKVKIERIKRTESVKEVNKFNSTVLGMHLYYSHATHVSKDFSEIAFSVKRRILYRLRNVIKPIGEASPAYKKFYSDYEHWKKWFAFKTVLFPIDGVKHNNPMNFTQEKNNYTNEGRALIHKNQKSVESIMIRYLMENPIRDQSIEYNDNRISMYIAQQGKCRITGEILEIGKMELHHKKPRGKGGSDKYQNLIYLLKDVHKLIHATAEETIMKYLQVLNLSEKQVEKVNKLRKQVGNCIIHCKTSF